MAFFRSYADNPRDLDLGFYLFPGGMKPRGLGKDRDKILNSALESALLPIAEALAARREEPKLLMVATWNRWAGTPEHIASVRAAVHRPRCLAQQLRSWTADPRHQLEREKGFPSLAARTT
jgi:hypothetical protein